MDNYGIVKKNWPLILLFSIGVTICVVNYTPGTFLSGWDTLHPEFNLSLAWNRALFGVWRAEEGLGAVAGHSHMADIPHLFIVSLFSFLFPQSFIRYAYIFLCFLLGPIGMYFLLRRLFPSQLTCFIGSLFYLLNIGTIQTFTVPFEMFVTQYALLPFLFFFATDFLLTQKRHSFFGFLLTTIFLSPIAFAATLWYITALTFFAYLFFLFFFTKRFKQISLSLQSFFLLLGSFLVLNLYWILPNIYFVMYHGTTVTHALMNQIFSEEAFLSNASFGNFPSIALLHTFYFHWNIFDGKQFVQLMQEWMQFPLQLNNVLGFFFFTLAVVGFVWSIKRQHTVLLAFSPALLIALVFLLNNNLPFHLYTLFSHLPFFQEAFRFPDDKVLGIFVLVYTLFFSAGIAALGNRVKTPQSQTLSSLLVTSCIFIAAFPVFTGHLFHAEMKVSIPQNYFALFSYMSRQPYGRIVTLPSPTLWGWEYYNWRQDKPSFQGSGFFSFGIPQAIMDRDFDRWNSANEQYYRELSYALYTQNQQLFMHVLHKYGISYILVDTSISNPGYPSHTTLIPEMLALLKNIPEVKKIKQFGNNLLLFKIQQTPSPTAFAAQLPQADGTTTSFVDSSFAQLGNYRNTAHNADITDNLDYMSTSPFILEPTQKQNLFPFLARPATINSCAPSGSGQARIQHAGSKKVEKHIITYTSLNGQFCDYVNIILPQKPTPSMLSITSKNTSGLSLRMCIADATTHHCLITTKLPSTSTFSTTSFFIPPLPTSRYSVNFDNIGISPHISSNSISHISVTPLPATTLLSSPPQTLSPLSYTSLANSSIYVVNSLNISPNATLLLSQAYEPGWHMYQVDGQISEMLTLLFPFLFGKSVGTHILINSWENGWQLSKDTPPTLIIIFLPQYLEYLGFVLGGICIGFSFFLP